MKFTAADIPDLTNKVAIVTGGNAGLGFATIKELVRKNAKVYMASRSYEKALTAIAKIKESIPNAQLEFMELNLADLKQVKKSAENFVASGEKLNILVNNAGIMMCPFELTKDGIESQLAVNHIGHFLFTTILLPVIERSAPSRIVNVSSSGHRYCKPEGILFDSINEESAMTKYERYGQSKLANILFTKSLADILAGKQVYANCVHPGRVDTGLIQVVIDEAKKNPTSALTQLYCATSDEIVSKDYRGEYFIPCAELSKPLVECAEIKELRDKLWEYSEKIVKHKTL